MLLERAATAGVATSRLARLGRRSNLAAIQGSVVGCNERSALRRSNRSGANESQSPSHSRN